MSESFATTYAKAVDDLAGKIFIPGLISSLLVEFGPWYQSYYHAGFIQTYMAFVIAGGLISGVALAVLSVVNDGKDFSRILAVAIMPLGFAGLFPEQFGSFTVPYSKVTGVAILAWSFVLLKDNFFGERN